MLRCCILLYWSISPTKGNRLRLLWGAWFLWLTTIASGKWREVPRQLSKIKIKVTSPDPKKNREFVLDFWEQHPFTFGNAWQATWFDGQDVPNESHNVTHYTCWLDKSWFSMIFVYQSCRKHRSQNPQQTPCHLAAVQPLTVALRASSPWDSEASSSWSSHLHEPHGFWSLTDWLSDLSEGRGMSFSGLFQNSFLAQRLLISNARFCIGLPRFAGEA